MDFSIINFKILEEDITSHSIINKTIDKFSLITNFTVKKTKGFKCKE